MKTDQKVENKVDYILKTSKALSRMSKREGFAYCKEYLIDTFCAPVIIKVKEDFKRDWYNKNESKLKAQYVETCLELETIYVANIYQGAWAQNGFPKTIFAQSLGQILRKDDTVENIADFPIEWMVVDV